MDQIKNLIIKDIKELSSNLTNKDNLDNLNSDVFEQSSNLTESNNLENLNIILENKKSSENKKSLEIYNLFNSCNLNILSKENSSSDIVLIAKSSVENLNFNISLGKNAFARLTVFSNNNLNINYFANCNQDSKLEFININLSDFTSDAKVILKENSSCTIANAYISKNNKTTIKDKVIHDGANSKSLILSKGYLIDSKTDSRGLIVINPVAFNSQGFQDSQLLLEGKSNAISVPDLEIMNNEVKCSHGSTISRIKDEDLFYFESRGISKQNARDMLIKSHILSIIEVDKIKNLAEIFLEEGDL